MFGSSTASAPQPSISSASSIVDAIELAKDHKSLTRGSINAIPDELLEQIIGYAMASVMPVDLDQFLRVGRELQYSITPRSKVFLKHPREYCKLGKAERREAFDRWDETTLKALLVSVNNGLVGKEFALPSKEEFELQCEGAVELYQLTAKLEDIVVKSLEPSLPPSQKQFYRRLDEHQKEHYTDWLLVTSTCHRLRVVGKIYFFSHKAFVLAPETLITLIEGKAQHMSITDQTTAIAQIRTVIAPMGSTGQFVRLPRYASLPRLRTLKMIMGNTFFKSVFHSVAGPRTQTFEDDAAHYASAPSTKWLPCPERLLALFSELGFELCRTTFTMCDNGTGVRQLNHHLDDHLYPTLTMVAARRRASRRDLA